MVQVVGFFPPPITGQAIATERTTKLIAARPVDLSVPGDETTPNARRRPSSILNLLRKGWQQIRHIPRNAPVLWACTSPSVTGHLRDALLLRLFLPTQPVYGIIHHGDFASLFRRNFLRSSTQWFIRRLNGFVFLDRRLGDACAPWIPNHKRFVIPNTVDDATLGLPKQAAPRIRRGGLLHLLFLSNMIPSKGYVCVLDAVSVLTQRGHLVKATFAGHWPDETAARAFGQQVVARNLTSLVHHIGPVTNRTLVPSLYAEACVFVLPTEYPTEAQPLTILEALATGTPVITTRQGGIAGMIDDGVEGFFVPPRDPSAIADAAERMMNPERWQQMSKAARARFDRQFHPDVVRQQWLDLLDGTLPHA